MDTGDFIKTLAIKSVNIAQGGQISSALDCVGMQLVKIVLPTNFTAGNLRLYGADSDDPDNFTLIQDVDGTPLSIPGTPNTRQPFMPYLFIGSQFLKVNCSVAQASDVILKMILQPIFEGIHN